MDHPLANRIRKNYRQLKPYLQQEDLHCYRVYDWDMPEFPLCIEVYEEFISIAEYQTRHPLSEIVYQQWIQECLEVICATLNKTPAQVYLRQRFRRRGNIQYEKRAEENQRIIVREYGLKFWVNFTDYLDTGLFLDHRLMRKRVREEAAGKSVLNLFAYTGSFSVYALAGGAKRVCTVDLSNTYLNWARDNMTLNGFNPENQEFIKTDIKEWLRGEAQEEYDLVIADPPTLSKSKMARSDWDVQADHAELLSHVLRHVKPGGCIYFSTNFREFRLQAARLTCRSIEDISLASIPKDFRNKQIHYCWKIIK